MSQFVAVPKGFIYLFCLLMVLALVAIGYLLGSRSASTNPHPSPATPSGRSPLRSPFVAPTTSLEERIDAVDKRVHAISQGGTERLRVSEPVAPQATASPFRPSQDKPSLEERDYLKGVDTLIGGTALSDNKPLGVKLLDRVMALDPKDRHALIMQTEQVRRELERLASPDSCREHKTLLLEELGHAVSLMREVTSAAESGDTARITGLVATSDEIQQSGYRLRQLDRELRGKSLP